MTNENYLQYLLGTVEGYSLKYKKHLKKSLEEAGIAQIDPQFTMQNLTVDCVDVSELEITQQIATCLREAPQAIKLYETWEFIKDYKYSSIFETDDFDQLIQAAENIITLETSAENEHEHIFKHLDAPLRLEKDNIVLIKFGLNFSAIHPLTEDEKLLKYPVIIALHRMQQLVEVRFDALKRIFIPDDQDQTIYADLIDDVRFYIESEFGCTLHSLDLNFMVKQDGEAKLIAQYTKLPSGGNAQLEVGNNTDYILPILGELKALLSKNAAELEKAPALKEALTQFIFENVELSEYSWIEVRWEEEIKSRSISIKIIFNYRNNNYGLVQHYYNALVGMERMNHVIRYINEHRGIAQAVVLNE